MKTRKFEIIECPKCGYEYLPAEIFVPKYYFGTPENIERDEHGKIINYEGVSDILATARAIYFRYAKMRYNLIRFNCDMI